MLRNPSRMKSVVGVLCLGTNLIVAGTSANAAETMPGDQLISFLETLTAAVSPPAYASVQGVGSGSVAPVGKGFISVGGTTSEGTDGGVGGLDGSFTFGAGLGEVAGVSSQISVSVNSVHYTDFGDSGSVSLKFGTKVPIGGKDVSVALMFDGLAGWGDSAGKDPRTRLAMSSRDVIYRTNGSHLAYSWSLGLGDAVAADDEFGLFGGVGVGINQYFGVSVAYDGRGVDLGAGVRVPWVEGLSVTGTVNDVFDTDAASGVTVSVAYSLTLF
jgi:hypothetical protein